MRSGVVAIALRNTLSPADPLEGSVIRAGPPPGSDADAGDASIRVVLALTSLAAAAIHFAFIGAHVREALVHGSFFILVAWAQATWGLAILVVPARSLLIVGAAGNLAVVVVWLASRTIGVPLGPEPWTRETIGTADLAATVMEAAIVIGCLRLLTGRRTGVRGRRWGTAPIVAYGLALALLSSGAIAATGDHAHAGSTPGRGHDLAAGSHGHDAGVVAAGEHSGPPHAHLEGSHEAGTPDISQLDRIRSAMARYEDVAVARDEGFERMDGDYLETGAHFGKPEWTEGGAYSITGDVDLADPEYLMYTKRLTGEWKLVAVAYVADMWEYPEPPTSLAGAPFHEHVWNCIEPEGWTLDEEDWGYVSRPECEEMGNTWSPGGEWMAHVWLIPNPLGAFADVNPTVV
jgi:hypothetical protein